MENPAPNRRRPRLRSFGRRLWRGVARRWEGYLFVLGYGLVFGFLGLAAVGLTDAPTPSPVADGFGEAQPPGAGRWLGTDAGGADQLIPTLRGAGLSVWLAAVATALGTLTGWAMGTALAAAGWRSAGRLLQSVDGWLGAFPAIGLALALVAGWGAGAWPLMIIAAAIMAMPVASQVAGWYREMDGRGDVLAARAMGWSRSRLMIDESLTHFPPRLAAWAAGVLPATLGAVTAVDFVLGRGGRLGHLLASGARDFIEAPWLLYGPGLVLAFLIWLLAALGWAVRRRMGEGPPRRLW
ncbi:MAG: hypothetical protein JNK37_05615 [Verrucomicrobiales bacterium]|nr:hypothetical protein [Verrucomicrobiales bacterium]